MNVDNSTTCSDPQLASLDPDAVNDCCILEFDVTPQCNQLTIKFIFGSEEYPEFAPPMNPNPVNDVFGFFVSGPNPAGGAYVNKNIAVINGSTTCSINNINPSTNSSYFVDNATGSGFVFDGYSTPITSTINVTPCQVYHFKLAISDVLDGLYDSGVLINFLQCTNTFSVATTSNPASCGLSNATATATVTGGIGTLSYNWSPAPGGGQGTSTATGLTPGQSYTVTVDDIYSCIPPKTSTIVIANATPLVTPTFTQLGPYCLNTTAAALPTSSTNATAITGTWSPAAINTTTLGNTTYTFTPNAGQCATTTTMVVNITNSVTPSFTQLGPYCLNTTAAALPTSSTNATAITGSWSPAAINTATLGNTTYTFTPNAGQCATTTTMVVNITNSVTPTFTQLGPYCINTTAVALPTSSTNATAITGTWSPAAINTATLGNTTYTFTPNAGQCASTTTMVVNITNSVTPTFTQLGPYCLNSTPAALPASSTNATAISGTWSPASISTTTLGNTTYTFTPASGQCASTTTMVVNVTNSIPPTFTQLGPYCLNSTPAALPASSTNATAITGTWSPASISTTTLGNSTYTFTPASGQCAVASTMDIEINPNPTVSVNSPSICAGQSTTVTATPGSAATYSYAWTVPTLATAPGNNSTFSTTVAGTYSVIITNTTTGCVSSSGQGVATVNPNPTVSVNSSTICAASSATVTATPLGGGTYSYTWTVPTGVTPPGNVATFPTSTNGNYSVVVTDQATLCSSASAMGIVTVINLPTATISGPATICSGNSASVTISGTPNAVVSYTLNSGAVQTVTLNAQGNASVSTGLLSSNATYSLTGIAVTTSPFCAQALSSSLTITVENSPTITFTSDITSGCAPLKVNFTNTTLNTTNCNWNFGNGSTTNGCGTVSHTFNSAGCYDITLTAASPNGCIANLKIPSMVCVEAAPVAAFNPTPDVLSSLNTVCTMVNISTGAVNYAWEFGDASTSTDTEPAHSYTLDEGIDHYTIKLIAYSPTGCSDTSIVTIKVYEELVYFIPNTFTPDGDKFNQTFQPVFTKGYDPYNFNMIIVNRWGETVFETNDTRVGWDGTYGGKIVQEGTYTWKINFKLKSNDDRKMETGHVILIR
jgi:gliding motility-associated-like protein